MPIAQSVIVDADDVEQLIGTGARRRSVVAVVLLSVLPAASPRRLVSPLTEQR